MDSKLLAYALDFASFLMQKTHYRQSIRNIILFGSVAREEASEESDIDIFIDVVNEDQKLEKELAAIQDNFLNSTKYKNYWKLLGVKNPIKLTIGILEKWKKLKPSLLANGLILFGKYTVGVKDGKHVTIFVWENIKPNSKRVLFNKQLQGYRQNNKFYNGLLQKYHGERLGKGCIAVPLEHSTVFLKLFRKYNITVKIKKVVEY